MEEVDIGQLFKEIKSCVINFKEKNELPSCKHLLYLEKCLYIISYNEKETSRTIKRNEEWLDFLKAKKAFLIMSVLEDPNEIRLISEVFKIGDNYMYFRKSHSGCTIC